MSEPTWRGAGDHPGASARQQYGVARRAARRRRALRRILSVGGLVLLACAWWGRQLPLGAAGSVLLVVAISTRPDRDPERWLRGAEGELRSAAVLQRLRTSRWRVLHDRMVPGLSVNLDHLVIGPSGVWVVDTKTYRTRLRRRWRRVEAGGIPVDTGPAAWEAELVSERLGIAVTPIVAVHGRGLGPRGGRCAGVQVIPATSLIRRLRCGHRVWGRRWLLGGRLLWGGRRLLGRAEVRDLAARADRLFPPRSRAPRVGSNRHGGYR